VLKMLAAAAGDLLDRGIDLASDYLESSGFYDTDIGKAASSVGSFLSDDLGIDLAKAGAGLAEAYMGQKELTFDAMPSAAAVSASKLAAGQMRAAGRAQQIPLGSGNRIPNMLQQPNVRNALMRVQTVPIPRSTIQSSSATISLSSAKVKSRYRKTK